MAITIAELEREAAEGLTGYQVGIGDTVRVHTKQTDGGKTRIQIFEGTVIAKKHSGIRETITVRRVVGNIGVEKIFPLYAPVIDKLEVRSKHRVRRAKLYYLRDRRGKRARLAKLRV